MTLCFQLSMPRNNSWNGKWSGDDKIYTQMRRWSTKAGKEKAMQIAKIGSYGYDFGDGWFANILVKEVSPNEAKQIKKKSQNGFCGYNWMIDSIIDKGAIIPK